MQPRIYIYDRSPHDSRFEKIMETITCMRYMACNQPYPRGDIICYGATQKGTYKKALRKIARGWTTDRPELVLRDD